MRYLVGFLCVCALSVVPLVGCTETTAEDGTGGGGTGGSAGDGGTVGSACDRELCDGVDCDDADPCTKDVCNVADGMCSYVAVCDDFNDCTTEMCDPADESCSTPSPVADGTQCAGGTCRAGACELSGSVLPCTEQGIRNAIAAGDDTYTFACDGTTPVVTQAEIEIDNDVILDGEGKLTVDGNCEHRVLSVGTQATVELHRLALSGGFAADGGGLLNDGALTMDSVTVARNATTGGAPPTKGAGILNTGTLTVMNSTVARNTGAAFAGGIWNIGVLMMTSSTVSENNGQGLGNADLGTVTLTDSIVAENTAIRGGGIGNDGTMTLMNCTVEGNIVEGGSGGGIVNEALGVLTLTNSTVQDNKAEAAGEDDEFGPFWGSGGGIDNANVLTLVNSTVSGNTAVEAGGIAHGPDGGSVTLINSTISGNVATGCEGISEEPGCGIRGIGGIWNRGPATLTNSTVSGNAGDSASGVWNEGELTLTGTLVHGECGGTDVVSNGYNIESPGDTCGFEHGTDLVNITEGQLALAPLQDNDGPTMTHALGVDSAAIDHIPAVDCEVTEDQRGQPRPETGGDACDVGSFERQPEDP